VADLLKVDIEGSGWIGLMLIVARSFDN